MAVAALAVTATTGFRDGPPARVTGGPGEDDCTACHYADMGPPASGRVTLSGFPERFTPGATYRLELLLEHADMVVGGFQLAIRELSDDVLSQAGSFAVPDEQSLRVGIVEERGIQFVQHRLDGAQAESDSGDGVARVSWSVLWTAPESSQSAVVHAALVAGDGDESQVGDAVYVLERQTLAEN